MKFSIWYILDILKIFAFLFVLAIGIIALFSSSNASLAALLPIKPYIVLTGSMRPSIYEGSVVFVQRNPQTLKPGDIITFIRPDNAKENVTHRIIQKEIGNKSPFYKTKGDANKIADPWVVRQDAIWGKVLFAIPLLGYIISFSTTKLGVILTIVLPLAIIVLDEIRVIYTEVQKIRKKKLEKIPQIVLVFLVGTAFLFAKTHPTFAAFSANAQVTNIEIDTISTNPIVTPSPTPCPNQTNTTITISGNGAGSVNTVNVSNTNNTTTTQSNNTSNNPFDKLRVSDAGGNSTIISSSAASIINIFNQSGSNSATIK